MTLVVDASVAAKWVLDETASARAGALRSVETLIAPSLIASEVGNALWKAVRRRAMHRDDAIEAIASIPLAFEVLVSVEELRLRALELAIDLDHPIYDCFYLALAERERCPLVTADKRLLTVAKKFKGVEVRAL